MGKHTLYIVITICALLGVTSTIQASPYFYFKQLSQQDGLPQNFVRSVVIDHDGFFWIGTKSGLSRYDWHEFKTYLSTVDSPTSLPDNLIHFIVEDAQNTIWVSTGKGVCTYQRKSDDFKRIQWENKPLQAHSYMLTDSALLLGGRGVIYRWDYAREVMDTIPLQWKDRTNAFLDHIVEWYDDYWILSTRWEGMWILNSRTGEVSSPDFFTEKGTRAVKVDHRGDLWISPYGKGLDRYTDKGKRRIHYDVSNSGLTNNVILDIEEVDNQLWLATDGGGISILDMQDYTFSSICYVPGDIYSFPVSSVFCLYRDNDNNMWAGTIRGGLFGIKETYMRTYRDVTLGSSYGMSDKTVLSLYEDGNGYVWIGTDGGGLNRFDPRNDKFTHYPGTGNSKVASISYYDDNELLLYLFAQGLFRFNIHTGHLTPFILVNEQCTEEIVHSGISVNIDYFDTDKIHLFADKIYTYDKKSNTFSIAQVINSNRHFGAVQRFYSDKDITYLFGHNYILKLDNHKNEATQILTLEYKEHINAACCDHEGNFWIGTTSGLLYYSCDTKTITPIETNMFREVMSVVYSNNGLWIGADGMLFRYVIAENKFFIYGESAGASPNEYLSKPTWVSQDGTVYMGGVSGLLRIDGNKSEAYMQPSPLVVELTDVTLDGVSVINDMDDLQTLRIPWNHTSLVVKTMAREKDIFRKKMFRFDVEGLNRSYIESYDHTLALHFLPVGKYRIMASCSTQDGEWSEPISILQIEVTPPWWKQSWFIWVLIVSVVAICYLVIFYTLKKKKARVQLEMKEQERKIYEDKVRFLINISHELRTPLTLIYAPLKRLLGSPLNDENVKLQLTRIFKQARQMRNIINMVLDMRRMEVGYEALHLLPHALNSWVESVVEDFVEEFSSKSIELTFHPDDTIDKVSFDKGKCEIVLSNFLMNALKFSRERTTVRVLTEKRDTCVRIVVQDEGIGLSDSDLSHMFTRFYQGEHQMSGSGIGLSYSKTLLELHGGRIGAYNNEGAGATFWFELQLTDAGKNVVCTPGTYLNNIQSLEAGEVNFNELEDFSVQDYSILVVDDEKEIRAFIKDLLGETFKRIYTAQDGIEGLTMVRQYQPDLVISDIMMPRMDGFEFCRLLKSDISISHIPVILLTARDNPDSLSAGYKLGADFYLSKPFDQEWLLTIIRNLLRNREQIKNYYRNATPIAAITPQQQTFSNADEQFMLKLNKLALENLNNAKLDVKYITIEMGMSRASLYNKVKALTGLGVNDYINRIRIEQAMQLLATTGYSISEISEQTGFSSTQYFSTLFKQITTMTPSEYREQAKSQKNPDNEQ